MRLKLIALAFAAATSAYGTDLRAAQSEYRAVSRCFWIYSALYEVGRDVPHAGLFQFGQPRMAWVGGYMKANEKDGQLRKVFDESARGDKPAAIQMLNSLPRAIASRNNAAFSQAVNQAIACDRALGFKTDFVPTL